MATPRGVAVLPGQFSLLRRLAASVCLVWGKAEPATCPSRTILHDVLNGQTATSNPNSRHLHLTHMPHVDIVDHASCNIHGWQGGWVTKLYYACALFIIDGLGHATWSSTMPVSQSQPTVSFQRNHHINFRVLVVVEPLLHITDEPVWCL